MSFHKLTALTKKLLTKLSKDETFTSFPIRRIYPQRDGKKAAYRQYADK